MRRVAIACQGHQSPLIDDLQRELSLAQDTIGALTDQNSELRTALVQVRDANHTAESKSASDSNSHSEVATLNALETQLDLERNQVVADLRESKKVQQSLQDKLCSMQHELGKLQALVMQLLGERGMPHACSIRANTEHATRAATLPSGNHSDMLTHSAPHKKRKRRRSGYTEGGEKGGGESMLVDLIDLSPVPAEESGLTGESLVEPYSRPRRETQRTVRFRDSW